MHSSRNYEIGRYAHYPHLDVYGIYIVIRPEMLEVPRVLADVLKLFAENELPIVHFKLSRPQLKGLIKCLIFFAIDGRREVVNDIIRELKKKDYIIEVEVIEPLFKGFVADTVMFPPTLNGERIVIFRQPLIRMLLNAIVKEYGNGFEALLYYIGYEYGKRAYAIHSQIAREDRGKVVEVSKVLFQLLGFGRVEVVDIDLKDKTAVIRIYDSIECSGFGNSTRPMSYFIRGMYTGWFEEFFGVKMRSEEAKCIAKGDPYCEMRFYKAEE
ncbi:MAG: hypothetical protein DRZ82_07375 [Thermoprotei archaeon]|nr:MAG: hypothetical protein DRZ82_07375 [Thermoprotei archaeon]